MQPLKEGCDRLNSILELVAAHQLQSPDGRMAVPRSFAALLPCIPVGPSKSVPVAAAQSRSFTNRIERTMWGRSRVATAPPVGCLAVWLSNTLRFYHLALIVLPVMCQVLGTVQPGSLATSSSRRRTWAALPTVNPRTARQATSERNMLSHGNRLDEVLGFGSCRQAERPE